MRTFAALLALLVIAGCGGDPQPKEPRSSVSASAKPTAVAVPTMPAQAKENSPEGAAAFVKHYIDVFNYASNTGDVTELSRLSSPRCKGCQSYIKLYRDTYAAGGYFKDSDWQLSNFEIEQTGADIRIFLHADAPKGNYRLTTTSKVLSGVGEDTELLIGLRQDSDWIVRTFDRRTS